MLLIPAIDLLDGGVVRLFRGDFDRRTRYAHGAVALAEAFRGAGATALHVVDLNAARGDPNGNRPIVQRLAAVAGMSVQAGGGLRNEKDVSELLHAGASRVVIGSLAVRDPERVLEWLEKFGRERVVIALDVNIGASGTPELLTHGWREVCAVAFWPLLARYARAGLRHLLCTDAARDGTLAGPNRDLCREILRRHPTLELQASGGIGGVDDIKALRDDGLPAAILGRALLDGRVSMRDSLSAAA